MHSLHQLLIFLGKYFIFFIVYSFTFFIMLTMKSPTCHGVNSSLRNNKCVEHDRYHKRCFKRTLELGECICQRWVRVDYTGDIIVFGGDWERFFAEKLRGLECEFLGYKPFGDGWMFFIHLREPRFRDDVVGRFLCKDYSDDVKNLASEDYDDCCDHLDNDLHASFNCCRKQFLDLVDPFLNDNDIISFASDGDFLRDKLDAEKYFFCS